jgi:hypothetical protein
MLIEENKFFPTPRSPHPLEYCRVKMENYIFLLQKKRLKKIDDPNKTLSRFIEGDT